MLRSFVLSETDNFLLIKGMISTVFLLSQGSGLVWILPALLFFFLNIYVYVSLPMRVYVHQVYTDVHGGQKALNTLKLDLQKVVSQLI